MRSSVVVILALRMSIVDSVFAMPTPMAMPNPIGAA